MACPRQTNFWDLIHGLQTNVVTSLPLKLPCPPGQVGNSCECSMLVEHALPDIGGEALENVC